MAEKENEKQSSMSRGEAFEVGTGEMSKSMMPPAFQLKASPEGERMAATNGTNSPAQQVATYIATEMNQNSVSKKAQEIKAKWDSYNPISKVEALIMWKDMVNYRAPWDHKPYIEGTWGQWQEDSTANLQWYFDIWSNIHYGYVGKACGFGLDLLLNAAGIAQWLGSSVPDGYWQRRLEDIGDADVFRALDDPSDQLASRIGYNLSSPSAESVLAVMRNHTSGLTNRQLA